MNIAHWLARSAKSFPDHPALALGTVITLSYRDWAQAAAARANALRSHWDVQPGTRIAVLAGNCPAYLEALYAIW